MNLLIILLSASLIGERVVNGFKQCIYRDQIKTVEIYRTCEEEMTVLTLIQKDQHDENLRRNEALGKFKENHRASADDVIRAVQSGDRNARLLLDLLLTVTFDAGWRAK